VGAISSDKCSIFLSHSSKDTKLIRLIELTFASREIEPYFAGTRMEGKNPVEKIVEAISGAIGLFALITPNVINDTHTRDWVVFEVGVAKAKGITILSWMDQKVAVDKSYPRLLENITDYDKFDCEKDEECFRIVNSIRDNAFRLAGVPKRKDKPTRQQLEEGLVQMEEAQRIAKEFIAQKKEFTNIEITSVEPRDGLWVVKGSISKSSGMSYGSEKWTVKIKGKEVIEYDFKPGFACAIF
jgi:hypothetical protein